ncbi:MAG: pyridoxamine 5'-phosphate oxidase family protein [Acidimicrobiia bacterium]|nr:pyridoxamine 5'-phosphate oxidase family protein [Acidimicrobiia bacterium]
MKGPIVDRNPDDLTDPVAIDIVGRMGVLDPDQCIKLIESTPIGRIGFWADGGPLVLPVNFALFEGSVIFRTLEGQKLAAASDGQTVCFEVDHWDASDRSGWSVVLTGVAREVTDWAEQEQLENIGLVPWAREKWRPMWVRIDPTEISGRVLR